MKVSKLIEELQDKLERFGDLPVSIFIEDVLCSQCNHVKSLQEDVINVEADANFIYIED